MLQRAAGRGEPFAGPRARMVTVGCRTPQLYSGPPMTPMPRALRSLMWSRTSLWAARVVAPTPQGCETCASRPGHAAPHQMRWVKRAARPAPAWPGRLRAHATCGSRPRHPPRHPLDPPWPSSPTPRCPGSWRPPCPPHHAPRPPSPCATRRAARRHCPTAARHSAARMRARAQTVWRPQTRCSTCLVPAPRAASRAPTAGSGPAPSAHAHGARAVGRRRPGLSGC